MVGGGRACDNGSPLGGVGQVTCNGSQFEPPLPGLYGYGSATCFTGGAGAGGGCTPAQAIFWAEKFHFNIMDQVLVPRELEAGEYALSFRWVRPIPAPFAPGPASFLRTDLRTAVLACATAAGAPRLGQRMLRVRACCRIASRRRRCGRSAPTSPSADPDPRPIRAKYRRHKNVAKPFGYSSLDKMPFTLDMHTHPPNLRWMV